MFDLVSRWKLFVIYGEIDSVLPEKRGMVAWARSLERCLSCKPLEQKFQHW